MIRKLLAGAMLPLLFVCTARGAAATQPADKKPDFSTPLAALKTSKLALQTGDVALMKRCYYTTDADEQKALDAIFDTSAGQVQFQQACAKRFGEDNGERVAPGFNLQVPPDAREEINGDRAKLYNIGGSTPTTLRRINGDWRFTYASMVDNNFRDLPPMAPAKLAQVFQISSAMYKSLCNDVAAGKFEHVEDAMNALRTRRQETWQKMQKIVNPDQKAAPAK